ncbi:hypothetical protein [Ammoniphilus sp. YIM 78166]|uniref:hypothetical protein n=1 Tax=Ammoniphilus sp. YIM 78166 TaxID=1644106 RepID=UPI00143147C8|nr:hypothetical protein [Ammoniphilus sp. YIM 78166]
MLLIFAMLTVVTVVFFKPSATEQHYYHLIVTAESENWRIEDYKIEIQPQTFVSGGGRIQLKSDKLVSEFFQAEFTLVSKNKQVVIWRKTMTGDMQISDVDIGRIEGPVLTEDGDYIKLDDIEHIYAQITWNNQNGDTIEERISLYEKG